MVDLYCNFTLISIIILNIFKKVNKKEILNLIKNQESEAVEFKKSLQLKDEIGEAVSAFSNTKGGTIIVGFDEDKDEITGVEIGKKTIEDLANYIKQHTDSSVFPRIKVEKIDGNEIVIIDVKESGEKPVFFKGRAYKRIGRSTHRITASEIRKLAAESKKIYWDEQICEGAAIEYINKENVKWFLRKAKKERNFDVDPETPLKEALERLKLIKGEKLTNAAVLLFGRNPQKFFLQARIRCARFKGTSAVDFLDMKIIDGNIIDQVDNAEKFILSHIKKAAKVVMFKREEMWEYPPDAVREAIANAVAHRDYECPGNIRVSVFDDRVEITDPGKLPEPLTPEMLKQNHESVPRNKLVSEAFFLIKNIEQWGRGTNKMVKWCLEHGLEEPDFEEIGGGFMVKFHAPEDLFSLIPEEGKVDLKELGLNERQIEALRLMVNEKRKLTVEEYSNLFNVNERTTRRDLQKMVKNNLISKIGKTKGAFFQAN